MGTIRSENLGRFLGTVFRRLAAWPALAAKWMVRRGVPVGIAKPISWLLALAIIVGLLYAVPVILLLALVVVAAMGLGRRPASSTDNDWFPKPTDHRDEPFYHPRSYNDDPDPRFHDKR